MKKKTRRPLAFLFALGLLSSLTLFACRGTFQPDWRHGFVERTLMTPGGPHRFYIYRPPHHSPTVENGKLPVILYLHGGGERGRDGIAATQVGLGPVVNGTLGYFPFLVVFPQCDPRGFWSHADMAERAMAALELAIREYDGDPERVYVTGNSMGGFGTYYLAARHPGRFAALAPICGGLKPPAWIPVPKQGRLIDLDHDPYGQMAQKLGQTPIWIFHGTDDPLIPSRVSRKMFDALKQTGGRVRYTEWPNTGHDAEVPTYGNPLLFEWFLKQRRGQPSADAGG